MPQIEQLAATYSSQIFWLLIFFGLTFFVIGRGMVPKVMQTVATRDSQIADDLAAAQNARDRADEQEEAWRRRDNENRLAAQAIIAEAKNKAGADRDRQLVQAQQRLDEQQEGAERRLAEQRDAAIREVENVAAEAARDVTARLAGIEAGEPEARAAVKEAMDHV